MAQTGGPGRQALAASSSRFPAFRFAGRFFSYSLATHSLATHLLPSAPGPFLFPCPDSRGSLHAALRTWGTSRRFALRGVADSPDGVAIRQLRHKRIEISNLWRAISGIGADRVAVCQHEAAGGPPGSTLTRRGSPPHDIAQQGLMFSGSLCGPEVFRRHILCIPI